ncbi:MAG: DUF4493 domain-containing protein [Parabacteroides sp.]|nr:DUF4493 domain-containing protein [Parabacteroides sp.]
MKKDLLGGDSGEADKEKEILEKSGLLDLEIKAQKEAALLGTKGDEDDSLNNEEFAISILDSLGQLVKYYESYADMRKDGGLLLPIGRYTVKASLGEDVTAGYDIPYYAGDTACFISGKEVVKVVTECKLNNKKVTFQPTGNFEKNFKDDYTIVLDNGLGVLTTTKEDSRTAYLKNTGSLSFVLYVTTHDNKPHTYSIDLSSNDSIQSYNNVLIALDVPEQSGGDPGEPEEPDDPNNPDEPEAPDDPDPLPDPEYPVAAPTIKVDVSLIEKDYIIEIPSSFVEGETPSDPEQPENPGGNEGDNPTTQKPTITGKLNGKVFDLSKPQTVTSSSQVIIGMDFPTGATMVNVDVAVGRVEMSIDLFNLSEDIKPVLAGIKLPTKGYKGKYSFNISSFMSMLDTNNTFHVMIKDANGQEDECTITLLTK